MKNAVSRFGKFLSGMVMPNIGAFIAWGFLTALFIEAGWFPNEKLASMVSPMLTYLLPILIAGQGGKMIAGDRGRVIAAIAVVGCICGSDYTMLMGAMVMGPLAGWVIKQFDKKVEGHIPAGFEMLINNFSVGILGMLLAILGYYVIGPFMTAILTVLTAGVDFLVAHSLLPLVSIFIEPAKVLFLNNAINHGIFSPIVPVCRQLFVLLPAAWLLAQTGNVNNVWWAFLIAEIVSVLLSLGFYARINKNIIAPMYSPAE